MARPIDKKDMEKFLGNKLDMERNPSGRHEGFSISRDLSIFLPGVLPVNLQHGRGDVSPHIVRQVCDFLGLTFKEFSDGKRCNIGGSVIYRALLWKHMDYYFSRYKENRSVYKLILEQYSTSAERSLPLIMSVFGNERLSASEEKVVDRITDQINRLRSDDPEFEEALSGRLVAFGEELGRSFQRA